MRGNLLHDSLKEILIESPLFLRNLVLYPLRFPEFDLPSNFLTLEDGGFSLFELDPPRVDQVKFLNSSDKPFFLLDGEELLGAKQDRVVNTSLWIREGEAFEIPVSCIERRRWEGGIAFQAGSILLNPSLRKALCEGVSESLSRGEGYRSNQRALWDSIEGTLTSLRISSKTSSFNDVYSSLKDEIESYLKELQDVGEEFSGFVVETPTLVCLDLFGSRRILARFLKKLLRSYLIEGFLSRGGVNPSVTKVKRFLSSLGVKEVFKYPTPTGIGEEIRFGDGKRLIGKLLLIGEGILHLSIFKVK